jgi:hypothetical protein
MTHFRSGIFSIGLASLLWMTLSAESCTGSSPSAPVHRETGEDRCATLSNGFGNFFYCPTSIGGLQGFNMPPGYPGYCMFTNENLGLVGYSAYTHTNGAYGAFPVQNQSEASALCRDLGNECLGYILCTRL